MRAVVVSRSAGMRVLVFMKVTNTILMTIFYDAHLHRIIFQSYIGSEKEKCVFKDSFTSIENYSSKSTLRSKGKKYSKTSLLN